MLVKHKHTGTCIVQQEFVVKDKLFYSQQFKENLIYFVPSSASKHKPIHILFVVLKRYSITVDNFADTSNSYLTKNKPKTDGCLTRVKQEILL